MPFDNVVESLADPSLIHAAVAFVVAAAGAVRQYLKTSHIRLSDLPWRSFRRLFYTARATLSFLEKPWPDNAVGMQMSSDELRDRIAPQSYNPNWPLSFEYKGEDLNARRYYYDPERDYPHRQLHIRYKDTGNGVGELDAHEEAAPEHHPKAHLLAREQTEAAEWVADHLRDTGEIDPREYADA